MQLRIQIDETELKLIIMDRLREMLGDVPLDVTRVRIEVKSKHNYRAEWEPAAYRAVYER